MQPPRFYPLLYYLDRNSQVRTIEFLFIMSPFKQQTCVYICSPSLSRVNFLSRQKTFFDEFCYVGSMFIWFPLNLSLLTPCLIFCLGLMWRRDKDGEHMYTHVYYLKGNIIKRNKVQYIELRKPMLLTREFLSREITQ